MLLRSLPSGGENGRSTNTWGTSFSKPVGVEDLISFSLGLNLEKPEAVKNIDPPAATAVLGDVDARNSPRGGSKGDEDMPCSRNSTQSRLGWRSLGSTSLLDRLTREKSKLLSQLSSDRYA